MSRNPYLAKPNGGSHVFASTGEPLAGNRDLRGGNGRSAEALVSDSGELNAGNKHELMMAISQLINAAQSGKVVKQKKNMAQVMGERQEVLAEALADRNGPSWQALGEVIGDEIWETLGREGFARRTMLIKPLGKGETGRVRIRRKDVISFFVTSNPNVIASQVRQFYIYPPEFYLIANIIMEDKEIEQAAGDLLDDKYQDGLEQIMVREDNIWRTLANEAAPVRNDLFFFNTFTPTVFTSMRTQIAQWGIPVTNAIIAFDLWNDIIADTEFSTWFDPVSKHEIVLDGSLGSILGVELITDAYRYETLRVLQAGEVYFLGAPQTLGAITQRKELATESINKYNQGRPERGWFMEQIEGMTLTNPRAIVRGQRA
jgi:hypothetical protein